MPPPGKSVDSEKQSNESKDEAKKESRRNATEEKPAVPKPPGFKSFDELVDETSEESFPASDPPGWTCRHEKAKEGAKESHR